MKKIEAVIRSEKVGAVRKALEQVAIAGLTLIQVDGHGNQRGTVQRLRGEEFKVGILPKTKLELIAADKHVPAIIRAICTAARTGQIGDGKIFVYPVEEAVRIRTGECGEKAL
ncbi:MAG TPA: P-II family nitrogen regulator [Candidatus Omnitrophota bacterium]|nr:P-II family nitrogen regulator [Candidatus Omnitrophota bacterium]HRZ14582.1 P-II family nitrogen regulator [Candidatus Omnitrophota bacterium]